MDNYSTTLNNSPNHDQYIFSSRLCLKFFNPEHEKQYSKYKRISFKQIRLTNIIISLCLAVYGLNIVISKFVKESQFQILLNCLVYVSIGFSFLSMLLYCFVSKNRLFFYERRVELNNLVEGINLVLIEFYFNITLMLFEFTEINLEIIVLIFTIYHLLRTLYVFFFLSNFFINFVCSLCIILLDSLLFKYCFNFKTSFLYLSIMLSLITGTIISYANELYLRLNFLKFKLTISKMESNYKNVFDNLKQFIISIDQTGNIIFSNTPFKKLFLPQQNTSLTFHANENNIKDNFALSKHFSNFKVFKYNKLNYSKTKENIALKMNWLQIILSSLYSINQELVTIDKKLYEFLFRIIDNNEAGNENVFTNYENLSKYMSNNNLDLAISINKVPTFKEPKKNAIYSDLNNNSDLQGLASNMLNSLQINNEINNHNAFQVAYNTNVDKLNDSVVHNNLLYLGKVEMKKIIKNFKAFGEEKEYWLYYIPSKGDEINLLIEPVTINKNMTESTKFVKSLLLSKISHEFKNPICSMSEIIDSIFEDLYLDLKGVKNVISPKYEVSKSIISDCCSPISYFDKLAISQIKSKPSIDATKTSIQKLNNLKCLSEIMKHLIKDFSNYSVVPEVKDDGTAQSSRLDIHNVSVKFPNKHNKSDNILPTRKPSKSTNNSFINPFKSVMFSKEFRYLEAIQNLVQVFKNKIQMDQKESKFSFHFKMNDMLPSLLEVDKDVFESFIFNTIFHFYKNISSGEIILCLKYSSNKSQDKGILYFVFNIKGSFNSNSIQEFFLKESEQAADGKFNNHNSLSSESCSFPTVFNENYRKITTSFEDYHVESLINNANPISRNNLIDSFNNNFHSYISCMQAGKIGLNIRLKVKSKKEIKLKFSQELDATKVVLKTTTNNKTEASNEPKSIKTDEEIEKKKNSNFDIDYSTPTLKIRTNAKRRNSLANNSARLKTFKKKIYQKFELVDQAIEESDEMTDYFDPTKRTVKNEDELKFDYSFYDKVSIVRKLKEETCENYRDNNNQSPLSSFKKREVITTIHLDKKEKEENLQDFLLETALINNKSNRSYKSSDEVSSSNPDSIHINSMRKKMSDLVHSSTKIIKKNFFTFSHEDDFTKKVNAKSYSTLAKYSFNKQNTKMSNSSNFFRVMICDDEILIQKTLKKFLNKISSEYPEIKFEIHTTENGFDCLNCIYKLYNYYKYFDILIIDETMPYMKGSHLINLLKSMIAETNFREINIISHTSYNTLDKIEYIYMKGADFVISKPISYDEFKFFFIDNYLKNGVKEN